MAPGESSGLPNHLAPSHLGEKWYWDHQYQNDLINHQVSATSTVEEPDEGTVWFSDANAERKVLEFLRTLDDAGELHKMRARTGRRGEENLATSFLDLGTGNGHMLFELREGEWQGRMVGVDYSRLSVELCQAILQRRLDEREAAKEELTEEGEDHEDYLTDYEDIWFEQYDIMKPDDRPECFPADGFNVVLDKGTFDAISLSDEKSRDGKRIAERYPGCIEPLVKDGGLFIVTSCNWTCDEVRSWFENRAGSKLKFRQALNYPTFQFGGQSGSKVCTVVFDKTP
ncbi:hypothetical protein NA57DRAFT_72812 [Rhizodiscina lignyota]|uniref:Protein-lysine N-methyltransferase EFM4 n=1 Tax=Rhizodiscina lignyota TaxID=1504668 RepID=A0A9P4M895_9PEZI|nr:hypothetical protein NA57DRAFT_72812 [Rhizodiscina lignyota]